MRFGWILVVVIAHCAQAGAQAEPSASSTDRERRIENFTLRDCGGKRVSLEDFKESRFIVVAFLGVECPLAKIYAPRLQKLSAEYRDRGVAFLGIDSNRQDSLPELAAYVRLHKIEFPVLKDPGNRVADHFAATRMSEVFVLDSEHIVRFHGRIDDQYGPGYARPKPSREDLRKALDELLADTVVSEPKTDVVGCLIGRMRVPDATNAVTYASHIAKILNKRCVECHREGEIGPFALTDYDEVVGWADMIAEVVQNGRMPPWHADPQYGAFEGDRRLSAEEKKLIQDWSAAGAPQGDLSQMPEPPTFLASGWQLGREPDLIVAMQEAPFTVAAEGVLDYQFFVVDPGFQEDKWVTAAEVLPGNRAVVHHATIFALVGTPEEALRDGTTDGYLATFVPGLRPTSYPPGMAKRIVAGSRLVFQIHYTPNGSEQRDVSRLGLVFADPNDVEYEVVTGSVINRTFAIPPGAPRHRVTATSIRSPRNSKLLSLMPHMHARGVAFRFEAVVPSGATEILLDVPHYDFNWQTAYKLVKPRVLPAGSQVHCIAHFDNSADNAANPDPSREVHHGIQNRDEMMVGYFDIAVRRDTEREKRPQSTKTPVKRLPPRRSR